MCKWSAGGHFADATLGAGSLPTFLRCKLFSPFFIFRLHVGFICNCARFAQISGEGVI